MTYLREYTYKNGKKVKCIENWYNTKGDTTVPTITQYDSEDRPKKISTDYGDVIDAYIYTYGKNGYIKKKKRTDNGETLNYLTFTYKWNGKKPKYLKSIYHDTDSGTSYADSESKFNKKGFYVEKTRFIPPRSTVTVKYKYKKGLVSTIDVKTKEGNNVYYTKHKITYTKTKIPADRYRKMINSIEGYADEYIGSNWY